MMKLEKSVNPSYDTIPCEARSWTSSLLEVTHAATVCCALVDLVARPFTWVSEEQDTCSNGSRVPHSTRSQLQASALSVSNSDRLKHRDLWDNMLRWSVVLDDACVLVTLAKQVLHTCITRTHNLNVHIEIIHPPKTYNDFCCSCFTKRKTCKQRRQV